MNGNAFEVEDILTIVLLKLPVKSLLIGKSVCKSWRRLICIFSNIKKTPLIFAIYIALIFVINIWIMTGMISKVEPMEKSMKVFRDLMGHTLKVRFVALINGLMCCYNRNRFQIRICNPALEKS